jgi:hypothetical protein
MNSSLNVFGAASCGTKMNDRILRGLGEGQAPESIDPAP